jgi:hypothetical protein
MGWSYDKQDRVLGCIRLFQIKTAITYGLEKKRIIYEKLSTQNFTPDFNRL